MMAQHVCRGNSNRKATDKRGTVYNPYMLPNGELADEELRVFIGNHTPALKSGPGKEHRETEDSFAQ